MPLAEVSRLDGEPSAKSTKLYERAHFAATADAAKAEEVMVLLNDRWDLVRLNACAYFARHPYPAAELRLADLSRSVDAWVSKAAIDALVALNTETAWAAVKRTMSIGPDDSNRQFAVRAMAKRTDHGLAGLMSALYGARSWRTRQAAVETIATLPSQESTLLLVAFLQEVDPSVRLSVTRLADMTNEVVCKRILWSSVNDPSEAVRAESYSRLAQSSLPVFAAEGLKGVRDESWTVRHEVVVALGALGKEPYRPAFRAAVADAHPWVRAAALDAMAALPGPVARDEYLNTLTDPHPAVSGAVKRLHAAKGGAGGFTLLQK
jgi:HEAT repeat protein